MIDEIVRHEYFETLESDPYNCLKHSLRNGFPDKIYDICHLLPWRVYWAKELGFFKEGNSEGYKLKILSTKSSKALYFGYGVLRYYKESTQVKDFVLPVYWADIAVGITELFPLSLTYEQKVELLK